MNELQIINREILKRTGISKNGNNRAPKTVIQPKALSGGHGRLYRRSAAGTLGTLSGWINDVVSRMVAENQKIITTDRANYLEQNDALAHGIIKGFPVEVVNTGITPNANPMTEFLGKKQPWEIEYQKAIYSYFEIWGLSPEHYCDVQRRMNFYLMQANAVFNLVLNGIALYQVAMLKAPFRPFSLSFLPIDPSRLQTPNNLKFSTNKDVYDGLELDKNGAPIKAYITKDTNKPPTTGNSQTIDIWNKKTGFRNLLLVCNVNRVAEYRQDSILAPMIKTLRDANDSFDAAVVNTMMHNIWSIFIENKFGQPTLPGTTKWEDREWVMDKGTLMEGNYGQTPHLLNPKAPGQNFGDMVDKIDERLGAATGKGRENIRHLYSASYSAARANVENAGLYNDFERGVLETTFNQPIMNWFMLELASKNLLPGVTYNDFISSVKTGFSRQYTRCQWFPPAERPIDKNKTAQAYKTMLQTNQISLMEIFMKQNKNWREGLREIAMIKKEMKALEKEYGIEFEGNQGTGAGDGAFSSSLESGLQDFLIQSSEEQ